MLKLKRLLALIIVVLAIQFLPVRLYADDPFKLMAEGKPAYTMKEVKNYVCKIVPLVENATGKKFLKIPRLVFADRKKMTKVLSRELMEPLSNLYPQLARDQINRMSQSQAALASMNLMGKYGVKDGKLYLLPKNMLPLLNLAEVDEKHTKSLLQLVIAHELTHALQDQETDLKRCYKITDIDRFSAFSATMEGQAVWVQEKVGRQLGLDDSVVEMSRLLSAGTIKFDDPAVEMNTKIVATQYEQIYLGGRKFISYIYQQGGNERVWEIIANPPLKTSMIAQPETYSAKAQVELNYAQLFNGLEKSLDGEGWQTQNLTLGRMALKSAYALMDEEAQEQILAQVQHAQCFIAHKTETGSLVSVSSLVIKDPQFASTYLKLLEAMVRKNIKALESSPSIQIQDFTISDFAAYPTDQTQKIVMTVVDKNSSSSARQVFVRIFKDKLMLEILISNYEMDDVTIAELAREVFERYQKLIKD